MRHVTLPPGYPKWCGFIKCMCYSSCNACKGVRGKDLKKIAAKSKINDKDDYGIGGKQKIPVKNKKKPRKTDEN